MTKPEHNQSRTGIRASVWLTVSSLLLLCLISMTLFRRQTSRVGSERAGGQESVADAQIDAPRSARRHAALEEGNANLPSPLTANEAQSIAIRLANERARALFDCEPFGDGPLANREETGWVWSERRGRGTGDLEATVRLAHDGSPQAVEVLLLPSVLQAFRLQREP